MNKTLHYWTKEDYYIRSKEGSLDISNPGMKILFNYAKKADSILDFGCGEGTRLNWLVSSRDVYALGVDISGRAIEMAKKQYPKLKFLRADIENFNYNKLFDLSYSAYVLEHVQFPEKVIENMLTLTENSGTIILMAPNYGAPNRRSPNSIESKFGKLIKGFVDDFSKVNKPKLKWTQVSPKNKIYQNIDDDTLVEPYLLNLLKFLKNQKVEVLKSSSLWEIEPWSVNPRKSLFKLLGLLGLFPFKYWGPQMLVVVKKIG